MDFRTFERVAREAYASIPPEFREGVDGLDVRRATVPHPAYPDVYTLGECLTEDYPSEFGGPGEVRSIVVLYYGSFLALSRLDETFDWEDEIFETVTHEVRHHLESLALDDSLEQMDYAEEQNFARRYGSALAMEDAPGEPGYAEDQNSARREGALFDPFFYRAGEPVDAGAWRVGGDLFVEIVVERGTPAGTRLQGRAGEREFEVRLPPGDADLFLVAVEELDEGDTVAVLLPRRRPWEVLLGFLRGRTPRVHTVPSAPGSEG